MSKEEEQFREAIQEEQRQARLAAQRFVQACRTGDVELLLESVDQLHLTDGGWEIAIPEAAKLSAVTPAIQTAFLTVWIESKSLRRQTDDDGTLVDALRILLPQYTGPSVRLFRGAVFSEHRLRTYGLSWSADFEVADGFARKRRRFDEGGALLETLAPCAAIISAPGGHYNESEYLVDPRQLDTVTVVHRYDGPTIGT